MSRDARGDPPPFRDRVGYIRWLLHRAGRDDRCPRCAKRDWWELPGMVAMAPGMTTGQPTAGSDAPPPQTLPMSLIICQTCFFVAWHAFLPENVANAAQMGVLDYGDRLEAFPPYERPDERAPDDDSDTAP